jgi:hypothetical protein
MLLVKTSNGQVEQFPYTLGDLRRDNPNTSYPKNVPDWMLADNEVYPVTRGTAPECDTLVQSLTRDAAPVKDSVDWVIGYTVENKPQEQAAAAIRNQRDRLLSETDWMALSDSPTITTEWANYRQALRDITGQSGFPYDVAWPTKPDGL